MLTPEEKDSFFEEIRTMRDIFALQSEEAKLSSTLEALEQFENQLTLNELETCFLSSDSEELDANLMQLLARRWERIRNSSMCYTQKPDHLVNTLCFDLAKALALPAETKLEIEALEPRTGPYFLLMPSLTHHEDNSFQNIHAYNFREFILSENQTVFIPIADCLRNAADSDEGILRHLVLIDDRCPPLTESEEKRITKHSQEATQWHETILRLNLKRFPPEGIISELQKLAFALEGGGVHAAEARARARARAAEPVRTHEEKAQEEKEIPGQEHDSGSVANIGIVVFKEYWIGVPEQQRNILLSQFDGLKNILDRLFRPDDADYRNTVYCVEILSANIRTLLERYSNIPGLEELEQTVSTRETTFRQTAKNQLLVLTQVNTNQPRHILPLIYLQLDLSQQKALFLHDRCDNAFIYALQHTPESLPEFDKMLDKASQQAATSLRIGRYAVSPLMYAARKETTDTINLLLRWGADIEAQDRRGDRALHWAAYHGNIEVVRYLLDKGASLEAKGYYDDTALHNAISMGHTTVVELLLQRNASLGRALTLAMERSRELTKLILMHLATKSDQRQSNYLPYAAPGSYPNVLFYVAEHHRSLFEAVLNKIIEAEQFDTLFNAQDSRGETPLILAVKLGSQVGIQTLLNLGVDIEAQDHNRDTALTWAVYKGDVDAVSLLLAHQTSLDVKGCDGNTALHAAILKGKNDVARLLFENNASISIKNNRGQNALHLAKEKSPELVQPILMHLATQTIEKQAECLLPYPNVLFYAAMHQRHLFENLIETCIHQQPSDFFNVANDAQETPLMLAIFLGSIRSMDQLLMVGVDINAYDIQHDTALHCAIQAGHLLAVKCLLDHGAALNIRNRKGMHALDLARKKEPQELVDFILMNLATRPIEEQAECLLPYPNVLFYAAKHRSHLFDDLIETSILYQQSPAFFNASNAQNETPLILASQLGSVVGMGKLLTLGVNTEAHDTDHHTALHWAILMKKHDSVACLFQNGASLNARNNQGETPLILASRLGDLGTVQHLLTLGAIIDAYDTNHNTALHGAIKMRYLDVAHYLLAKGASFKAVNNRGETPLILASKLGDLDMTQHLLTLGADVEAYDINHNTALHWAILNKNRPIIDLLVHNGVFLSTRNNQGETPLILASKLGDLDMTQHLLTLGADVEAYDTHHNTALHWAIQNRFSLVAKCLLSQGASFNDVNRQGKNALELALERCPEQLIAPILLHLATQTAPQQAKCLSRLPNGPYPNVLFYAAKSPHLHHLFDDLIERSITQQPKDFFHSSNENKETPLILASKLGCINSIQRLLTVGVDIEAQDIDENTALHWAIQAGRRYTVDYLLDRDASLNAKNKLGKNALELAFDHVRRDGNESILTQVCSHFLRKQPELLFELFAQKRFELKNGYHLPKLDDHIRSMIRQYQKLNEKAQSKPNYKGAAAAAKTVLTECMTARILLNQRHGDIASSNRRQVFKHTCIQAIEAAKPVLEKHREWGKVFAAFLAVILTFPITLPLFACGFFSVKTKSEQLLDNLRHEINNTPSLQSVDR